MDEPYGGLYCIIRRVFIVNLIDSVRQIFFAGFMATSLCFFI